MDVSIAKKPILHSIIFTIVQNYGTIKIWFTLGKLWYYTFGLLWKKLWYFTEKYGTLIYYRKVIVVYRISEILTHCEKCYGYILKTMEFYHQILLWRNWHYSVLYRTVWNVEKFFCFFPLCSKKVLIVFLCVFIKVLQLYCETCAIFSSSNIEQATSIQMNLWLRSKVLRYKLGVGRPMLKFPICCTIIRWIEI